MDTLTFTLLLASILSLWFPHKRPLSFGLFLASSLAAFSAGILTPIGVCALVLLTATSLGVYYTSAPMLCLAATLFVAYGLESHLFPGFHNVQIPLSSFTMWLNFDKVPMAVIILLTLGWNSIAQTKEQWKKIGSTAAYTWPLAILALLLPALLFGYVTWDPKIPNFLPLFLVGNLFFTSLSEEVFYRGMLQNFLNRLFHSVNASPYWALIIASLCFGLRYHAQGPLGILLASIAGLFYGLAFLRSNQLEAAIITHYLVNLTDLLFFTHTSL